MIQDIEFKGNQNFTVSLKTPRGEKVEVEIRLGTNGRLREANIVGGKDLNPKDLEISHIIYAELVKEGLIKL